MPDGVGDARAEAEGEVALARVALDDGELEHAAAHLGNAVASDPSLPDAYADLAGLADRAGDVEALFPLTGRLYTGTVAARSYLMYRAGHRHHWQSAEAVGLGPVPAVQSIGEWEALQKGP